MYEAARGGRTEQPLQRGQREQVPPVTEETLVDRPAEPGSVTSVSDDEPLLHVGLGEQRGANPRM